MIPYDATQHIQGISQGVGSAMPSLIDAGKRNAPGNPDLEAFINNSMDDYVKRRQAGEPKENIIADYLKRMQSTQYPDATQSVPSVGANAGTPALGTPDMSAATSQPPNSFPAQGSFNGATPPSLSNPSTQGIGGNATPPVAPSGGLPAINNQPVDVPTNTMNGPSAILSRPGTDNFEKPMEEPIPYEEKPKIDLTAGRDTSKMQTQTGGKIPPMRTRVEQEQAMSDIERMKKIEHGDDALDIKRLKLEQDSQLAIIKNMRLTKNDIGELQAKIQGLDQKAQIAVVDMWLKNKSMEQKFKLGNDRNKVLQAKGANQMPIELKDAKENFHKAAGRATAYLSKDKVEINGAEAHRVNAEREETRKRYNKMVEDYNKANGTRFATIDIDGRNVDPPVPTTGIDYTEEE